MSAKIALHFGALAAPIRQQLDDQGGRLSAPNYYAAFQADADAIARLAVRGLLSAAQAEQARKRLLKRVAARLVRT